LFTLPVAFAFDNVHSVLHVFIPAFAEQRAGQAVFRGLGEQVVGLHIAAARAIDDDPLGKFASAVVCSERRNDFAVPEAFMFVIKFVGAGAAEKYC